MLLHYLNSESSIRQKKAHTSDRNSILIIPKPTFVCKQKATHNRVKIKSEKEKKTSPSPPLLMPPDYIGGWQRESRIIERKNAEWKHHQFIKWPPFPGRHFPLPFFYSTKTPSPLQKTLLICHAYTPTHPYIPIFGFILKSLGTRGGGLEWFLAAQGLLGREGDFVSHFLFNALFFVSVEWQPQ